METRKVLIDTNLFIEHIRARDKTTSALARIQEQHHQLVTSSIVVAELCYGARSSMMRGEVDKVLYGIDILPFTAEMAFQVSLEAERLKAQNCIIGFRDLAIACIGLISGLPIATLNRKEFGSLKDLLLFNFDELT